MTSTDYKKIECEADAFLQQDRGDNFITLNDLSGSISTTLGVTDEKEKHEVARKLESYLSSQTEDVFLSHGKVIPRRFFFRDAQFKVQPTDFEVDNGILFPGARFAPFCSPELFYDEYRIREKGGKEFLKTKMVKTAFSNFAVPTLLLGRSGLLDSLAAECDENRALLRAAHRIESTILTLSAYNMAAFYKAHGFKHGDAVIFTVKDWDSCEFVMEYCASADLPSKDQEDEWLEKLENGLLEVCSDETEYQEIPDQISLAYLHAWEQNADIRHKPYLSLEEYQLRMLEIEIRKDGPDWRLVSADDFGADAADELDFAQDRMEREEQEEQKHGHCHDEKCSCGHDHAHVHEHGGETEIRPEHFSISRGVIDSLEDILEDIHAPVNEMELIAMMQDAFSRGEEDFSRFRKELADFLQVAFADDAQEIAFDNFLEEDWEIYQEQFNPLCDEAKQSLRTRLLDLTNARIETAVSVLEHYKNSSVPAEIARDLKKIHSDVFHTLAVLSTDIQLPDDAVEQLEMRVSDLEDAWYDFSDSLQERMERLDGKKEDAQ